MLKKIIIVLILLVLPISIVFAARSIKNVRGLYWMYSNYDPDYAYLLNGLNIIEGRRIGHIDHPGTPVQSFSGLVTKFVYYNLQENRQPTIEGDVIANPEIYLHAISASFVGLIVLASFALGYLTWFMTKNLAFALLAQTSPYVAQIIPYNSFVKVSPEALLLVCALAMNILVVMYVYKKKTQEFWYTMGFAFIAGLSLAVKINSLPLVAIPFFVLRDIKNKLLYLAGTGAAFVLFTWPIREQYGRFFGWVRQIFDYSGKHGTGTQKIVEPAVFVRNLGILSDIFPYFVLLLSAVLVLALLVFANRKWRLFWQTAQFRAIIGIGFSALVGILIVAKHLGAHYLLPTVASMPLLVLLLLNFIKEQKFAVTLKFIAYGFFIVMMLGSYWRALQDSKVAYADYRVNKNEILTKHNVDPSQFDDYQIILKLRSHDAFSGLMFGDVSASRNYGHIITKLYPQEPAY